MTIVLVLFYTKYKCVYTVFLRPYTQRRLTGPVFLTVSTHAKILNSLFQILFLSLHRIATADRMSIDHRRMSVDARTAEYVE